MLGILCTVNRNSGSVATPTWNPIQCIQDAALNISKEEFNNTTRRNKGVKTTRATTAGIELTFKLKKPDQDAASGHPDFDDFAILEAAWNQSNAIELAALDGPAATNGTKGLRGWWEITQWNEDQSNDAEVFIDCVLKAADVPTAALAADTSLTSMRRVKVASGAFTHAVWGSDTFS